MKLKIKGKNGEENNKKGFERNIENFDYLNADSKNLPAKIKVRKNTKTPVKMRNANAQGLEIGVINRIFN